MIILAILSSRRKKSLCVFFNEQHFFPSLFWQFSCYIFIQGEEKADAPALEMENLMGVFLVLGAGALFSCLYSYSYVVYRVYKESKAENVRSIFVLIQLLLASFWFVSLSFVLISCMYVCGPPETIQRRAKERAEIFGIGWRCEKSSIAKRFQVSLFRQIVTL